MMVVLMTTILSVFFLGVDQILGNAVRILLKAF